MRRRRDATVPDHMQSACERFAILQQHHQHLIFLARRVFAVHTLASTNYTLESLHSHAAYNELRANDEKGYVRAQRF